jgi:hypothetical protein
LGWIIKLSKWRILEKEGGFKGELSHRAGLCTKSSETDHNALAAHFLRVFPLVYFRSNFLINKDSLEISAAFSKNQEPDRKT